MHPPEPAPSYLVELIHPATGVPSEVDICAQLAVAVQRVHAHLASFGSRPSVELSYDADGSLEGVGFFDQAHDLISCITVYRLHRDNEQPTLQGLTLALSLPEPARSIALNQLFQS